MTIFCERAKTRMKELHITTRQLAKSIGMTESTVSRYLSGNRSPKIEELVKIAETLECSADYLLGLKESENSFMCFCNGSSRAKYQVYAKPRRERSNRGGRSRGYSWHE